MPPRRDIAETPDIDVGVAYQLGQISGQLHELIHTMNNIQQSVGAVSLRVVELEKKDNQREGANGLWRTFLKSPAIGWLVGAAVTAWAILSGRAHP